MHEESKKELKRYYLGWEALQGFDLERAATAPRGQREATGGAIDDRAIEALHDRRKVDWVLGRLERPLRHVLDLAYATGHLGPARGLLLHMPRELAAIAGRTDKARTTFSTRHKGRQAIGREVESWLDVEARSTNAGPLMRSVRIEAQGLLDEALAGYDALRLRRDEETDKLKASRTLSILAEAAMRKAEGGAA